MNDEKCAISLCETIFRSKKNENHGFDVTPSGIITFFSGNIISTYYDKGKNFEPWLGSILGTSGEVSSISWCRGPESEGETPLNVLVSDKSGLVIYVNMVSRKALSFFALENGYAVSILWHPFSTQHFYIATSKGDVMFLYITHKSIEIVWKLHVDFGIDFFEISPHLNRQLFIGSKTGKFGFIMIDKYGEASVSELRIFNHTLVDAKFYPYMDNTIAFITATTIYLYIVSKGAVISLYAKGSEQNPLLTAYFPNPQNERSFLLVFQTHCQYYQNDNETNSKIQNFSFLTPYNKHKPGVLSTAFTQNKLYVLGYGNTLQLFELRNNKFWCTKISRSICETPADFDCLNNSMCYATKSGIIHVKRNPNSSALSNYYKFNNSSISQIVWLTESSLLASLSAGETQKVFYGDLEKNTFKSILKPSMEVMSKRRSIICLSPSRAFIAIIIDLSAIAFYTFDNEKTPIFVKLLFFPLGTIGDFASDNEFWTFDIEGKCQKYRIDLNATDEVVYSARVKQINKTSSKFPTTCCCIGDILCVGFENGDFWAIDWNGSAPEVSSLGDTPIHAIIPSRDHSYCYITNNSMKTYRFTAEKCFETINVPTVSLKFLTSKSVLVHNKFKQSLTLSSKDKLTPIQAKSDECFQNDPIMVTSEMRKEQCISKKVCDIGEEIALLNRNLFYFIADALSSIYLDVYNPNSYCTNFTKDRMHRYLESLLMYYNRDDKKTLKTSQMRVNLMNNNRTEAFNLLIETPPSDPNFAIDVVKASFIDYDPESKSTMAPSVAALVAGGKLEDAIDILMLAGQYTEAARQLIGNGYYSSAILLAKTLMSQTDFDTTIDIIVEACVSEKRVATAISILISCRKFERAVSVLKEFDFPFPASIVKCIKVVDDKVVFDPSSLL